MLPGGVAGVDLDGEYFSERTDLALDWFPVQRPLLYHHGLDEGGTGVQAIGRIDSTTATKAVDGWWVQAQLDKAHAYYDSVKKLIGDGALFSSSGAMPHLVRTAKDGEILRWPWVEQSLTPTPANVYARVEAGEAVKHYKAAGITPPPTISEDDPAIRYAESLERLLLDVPEFVGRTKSLVDVRHKEGRALSNARRQRLSALLEAFTSSADDLRAMLTETEPAPHKETQDGKSVPAALVEFLRFQQTIARLQGVAT